MTRTHDSHGRLLVRIGKVTVVRRPLQPMVCSGRLTLGTPKRNPLPEAGSEAPRNLCHIRGARGKPTSNSMFDLSWHRSFDGGAPGGGSATLSGFSELSRPRALA